MPESVEVAKQRFLTQTKRTAAHQEKKAKYCKTFEKWRTKAMYNRCGKIWPVKVQFITWLILPQIKQNFGYWSSNINKSK